VDDGWSECSYVNSGIDQQKVLFGDILLISVQLLEFFSPQVLQLSEAPNIQTLQCMCAVWRKANDADFLLPGIIEKC